MRPEDHAIDMMLEEDLGGVTPPDLHDRILSAATRRGPVALPSVEEGVSRRRRFAPWLGLLIGAATVLVSIEVWPGSVAESGLSGRVDRGRLTMFGAQVQTLYSGTRFTTQIARGDRWLSGTSGFTRLKLDDLGVLTLSSNSEIEVTSMVLKEFRGGVVVGAVTVAVVAGVIRWAGGGDEVAAGVGQEITLAAGTAAARSTELESELVAAKRRIAELELSNSRKPETEPELPDSAEKQPIGPLFEYTGYEEAMADIDWEVVGEAINDYLAVHGRIVEAEANGEEVTLQMKAEAEEYDSRMLAQAAALLDAGLPGMTGTSQLHHPIMMSNLFNAALAQAGVPLDEAQRRLAQYLTRNFTAEDETRRAKYTDDTLDLERFVDEADMQGRYLREMRGMLSAKQAACFELPHSDRVGVDPVSDSYTWRRWNRRVFVSDREDLARQAIAGFSKDIGLGEKQRDLIIPLIEGWAQSLPAEWLDRVPDKLDQAGYYATERVRVFAKSQLQLMRDMITALNLDPTQLENLRKMQMIIMPFIR